MQIPMPPKWFHPHGMKMDLGGTPIYHTLGGDDVLIGSRRGGRPSPTVAQLQIRHSVTRGRLYKVSWRIMFTRGENAWGDLLLSGDELRQAFGILSSNSPIGDITEMKERYDAESSIPGHFIRKGKFLNIPMPGTGMDGDPNISIFITEEMQEAIRNLLR